jgi:hypothetical protein
MQLLLTAIEGHMGLNECNAALGEAREELEDDAGKLDLFNIRDDIANLKEAIRLKQKTIKKWSL